MGKSKLCHKTELLLVCSRSTRFPVSCKCNSNGFSDRVLVSQTSNCPASDNTRLPFLRRESEERFPFTGMSRLAIHTTCFSACENHTPKQYAFSPTRLNPAVNVPFGDETITSSSGLSTERGSAAEEWKYKKRRRMAMKVVEEEAMKTSLEISAK